MEDPIRYGVMVVDVVVKECLHQSCYICMYKRHWVANCDTTPKHGLAKQATI
jgi:hypothetical protein